MNDAPNKKAETRKHVYARIGQSEFRHDKRYLCPIVKFGVEHPNAQSAITTNEESLMMPVFPIITMGNISVFLTTVQYGSKLDSETVFCEDYGNIKNPLRMQDYYEYSTLLTRPPSSPPAKIIFRGMVVVQQPVITLVSF